VRVSVSVRKREMAEVVLFLLNSGFDVKATDSYGRMVCMCGREREQQQKLFSSFSIKDLM